MILFRLAGHQHVRLSTNTPGHWEKRALADAIPSTPSSLGLTGMFGPIEHFDAIPFEGRSLKLD